MSERWLKRLVAAPRPAARLLCFPSAGAGGGGYRPWGEWLPEGLELWTVNLPGRELRFMEAAAESLHVLVEGIVAALDGGEEPWFDLPYLFFGHSFGALLAFELTRNLRARGMQAPALLAVSGFRAPDLPPPRPAMHTLDNDALREQLRRIGGTPLEVLDEAEMFVNFEPVIRADLKCCESYRYRREAPLACPILALGGERDPLVAGEEIAAWSRQAAGRFDCRLLPGGHFYLSERGKRFVREMEGALHDALSRLFRAC